MCTRRTAWRSGLAQPGRHYESGDLTEAVTDESCRHRCSFQRHPPGNDRREIDRQVRLSWGVECELPQRPFIAAEFCDVDAEFGDPCRPDRLEQIGITVCCLLDAPRRVAALPGE